ncbi:hypothetical protein COB21_00050 [Candidatus Aerophobetes bacterium]|uniref:Uncharacterized protein n=1 Tax=Aerophobetes bacterium TaxID=2030807 RepID=A0A2A4X9H9_UNCAE|nr:MAG: hypothetical protein COB21_00050 [Candidatus Aerophobetes bacterium]
MSTLPLIVQQHWQATVKAAPHIESIGLTTVVAALFTHHVLRLECSASSILIAAIALRSSSKSLDFSTIKKCLLVGTTGALTLKTVLGIKTVSETVKNYYDLAKAMWSPQTSPEASDDDNSSEHEQIKVVTPREKLFTLVKFAAKNKRIQKMVVTAFALAVLRKIIKKRAPKGVAFVVNKML